MVVVRRSESWREFLELREAWNHLATQRADGSLIGHEWTGQCWKCAPLPIDDTQEVSEPEFVSARDADGNWLALTAWRRRPGWVRRLAFLDDIRSQRADLAMASGREEEALDALGRHLRRRWDWDALDMLHLREATALSIERQWPRVGLRVCPRATSLQRVLRLDRSWEAIEAEFSPALRTNLRRREKRLQQLGEVEVSVVTETRGLREQLRRCFLMEARGWKGEAGTAVADSPQLSRFYRQLAFRLAGQGRLWLFCLLLNGEVIAWEYCVATAGSGPGKTEMAVLASLKIAYDQAYGLCSPGAILRQRLLRMACGQFESYDFLGDDAPWKADWTSNFVRLRDLRVYNRTLRGWAMTGRERWKRTQRQTASGYAGA